MVFSIFLLRTTTTKKKKKMALVIVNALFYGVLACDEFVLSVKMNASAEAMTSSLMMSKIPMIFENFLEWVPSTGFLARVHFMACVSSLLVVLLCWKKSARKHAGFRALQIFVAVCYNFAYWANALDQYQHKYFLCLVLILLPWPKANGRLIVIQFAILYFWTAVAKVTDGGVFLSGDLLKMTTQRREVYDGVHFVSALVGVEDDTLWALSAWCVVVVELVLCLLLLTEDARVLTAIIGITMHANFEVVGNLSIGWFSYYMIAFYVFLITRDFAHR